MKWFKHETDAHANLKIQSLLDKFGLEAIGYYWSCVELVGLQGENFRIKSKKDWKLYLKKFLGIEEKKQELILVFMADKNIIDKKALKQGDLYIPKLAERCDDYTDKLRRLSRQGTDNVPLEEIRRDKKRKDKEEIRREKIFTPPLEIEVKNYCLERKNSVDPERWINFYSAKGWMIGKNKMKDWKAAVRTWEKGEDKPKTLRELTKKL